MRGNSTLSLAFLMLLTSNVWAGDGDRDASDRLSLADLVNYRAALTGKATADDARASDPPLRVGFKDVWNRPQAFRGRRITIEGRIQRIFRQGPVGDFPSLSEIWIVSAAGDPFCLVTPIKSGAAGVATSDNGPGGATTPDELPRPGQIVRFTGTFLKMVRYAAGDGDRLAPLVVGNRPPVYLRGDSKATSANSLPATGAGNNGSTWVGSWPLVFILTLLVTGTLAIRHLRIAVEQLKRRDQQRRAIASLGVDPPLEFVEAPAKQ